MDSDEFDERLARLLTALDEVVPLLLRHGSYHWAASLDVSRWLISNGDRSGFDHLLSGFGGMGSLNDLVLHPLSGSASDHHSAEVDDDILDGLRHRLFTEATALRGALDRP